MSVESKLDEVLAAVNATDTSAPEEASAAQRDDAVDALAVVTALSKALASHTYEDAVVFAETLRRLR